MIGFARYYGILTGRLLGHRRSKAQGIIRTSVLLQDTVVSVAATARVATVATARAAVTTVTERVLARLTRALFSSSNCLKSAYCAPVRTTFSRSVLARVVHPEEISLKGWLMARHFV
jgi:hypothetical protein